MTADAQRYIEMTHWTPLSQGPKAVLIFYSHETQTERRLVVVLTKLFGKEWQWTVVMIDLCNHPLVEVLFSSKSVSHTRLRLNVKC